MNRYPEGVNGVAWQPALRPPLVAAWLWVAVVAASNHALGWSDRGHFIITEEAVRRLPDPLQTLLAEQASLDRLKTASAAPDAWRKTESPHYRPDERPKHFFDVDAITQEPHPFTTFPRDPADAEKQFGAKTLDAHGRAPWAAEAALDDLVESLAAGRTDAIFLHAGELAHYAADLHMPFHVTKNYNGALTGNDGIHTALEIGLVHRYIDFYAAEVRKGRCEVAYLDDVRSRLFDWVIEAYPRSGPILEADSAARRKTGYNPALHREELDDLASDRARPYYAALKAELESRGLPEAVAMRDAAAHLADLFYTAWVRAGKPATLAPEAETAGATSATPYVLVALAAALLLVVLWPRRPLLRPPG